ADVVIVYLNEQQDAEDTRRAVEKHDRDCALISGDVGDEAFCKDVVERVVREFGRLDILVNNAAEQHVKQSLEEITAQQLERTFRTNIFSMFYLTKASLRHIRAAPSSIQLRSPRTKAARTFWTILPPRARSS